jgi:hypothetical protein
VQCLAAAPFDIEPRFSTDNIHLFDSTRGRGDMKDTHIYKGMHGMSSYIWYEPRPYFAFNQGKARRGRFTSFPPRFPSPIWQKKKYDFPHRNGHISGHFGSFDFPPNEKVCVLMWCMCL